MNRWSHLLTALAFWTSACQSNCDCAATDTKSLVPCPSGTAAAPAASAALIPATPATSSTPPPTASDKAAQIEEPPTNDRKQVKCGFIEIQEEGATRRLTAWCGPDGASPSGSYAEVLDPNTAKPRFIITGGDAPRFSIVGTTVKLPGTVDVMRVAWLDPASGEEWTSTSASLRVTEFGAVGKPVKGTFEAVMAARLNRPAVTIRGQFDLPRAPDRFAP